VIQAAPFTFFGAVVAVGFLLWLVIHFAYKSRLESAGGEIKNKDSEIQLLTRQLDQAKTDIKAFQKPVEPRRTAEVVRHWPEPLMRTFTRLAEGEQLSVKVHPQTPNEKEQSLTASYLVSVGLADIQRESKELLTVSSSSATGPVFDVVYVDGGKKNTD